MFIMPGPFHRAYWGLDIFLLVMLMLIIGGIGVFPGAFIGGFIIIMLNEAFRPLGPYRFLIFGTVVIVAIKAMPEGLLGKLNQLLQTGKAFSRSGPDPSS